MAALTAKPALEHRSYDQDCWCIPAVIFYGDNVLIIHNAAEDA